MGGRLQQSQLNYNSKHQIILHPQSHLTRLNIENEHIRLLHAGVQLTQCSLRQRYWIINDTSYIRSVIHKCLTCIRFRATGSSQLLGQLPSSRAVSYTHLDVYKRQDNDSVRLDACYLIIVNVARDLRKAITTKFDFSDKKIHVLNLQFKAKS